MTHRSRRVDGVVMVFSCSERALVFVLLFLVCNNIGNRFHMSLVITDK
ncbi:hypothetical protein C7M52_02844 [Mixta theicola]|nr:hypothetical protein C7M52_02844 [Mixta theicola]